MRISDWSSDVVLFRSFEFDSVLRDPDHLLGDLDVDIGSLDLLRDIEPDDPPVRLGEDHARLADAQPRETLPTRFDGLRLGAVISDRLERPIPPLPGALVIIHGKGGVRATRALALRREKLGVVNMLC